MKTRFSNPTHLKNLVLSAVFLALALVLPFLTGQISQLGNALCPMHIPVLLCGFLCGWPGGLVVGFMAPLLRFVLYGMPPLFPTGVSMALELATYGFMTGILYKLFPKKIPFVYINLIISMIAGRLVWGAARYLIAGFQNTAFGIHIFWAEAVTNAIPGIIIQIILIPLVVIALKKSNRIVHE
ncbi:MAG TPA: ECF transporter S component [Clostridiales bacterium]|jgi:thiamine transporter ThiT|nr:ECF transporter S component [Clostridiales bacterium]